MDEQPKKRWFQVSLSTICRRLVALPFFAIGSYLAFFVSALLMGVYDHGDGMPLGYYAVVIVAVAFVGLLAVGSLIAAFWIVLRH